MAFRPVVVSRTAGPAGATLQLLQEQHLLLREYDIITKPALDRIFRDLLDTGRIGSGIHGGLMDLERLGKIRDRFFGRPPYDVSQIAREHPTGKS